jgi:hypothetical protein
VAGIDVAAFEVAAGQHIAGEAGMQDGRALRERRIDACDGRLWVPGDRQLGVRDAFDRCARADERQHRLAAEAHGAGRQHRLILHAGEDTESILARHILGGKDRDQVRTARLDRLEVAQREAGARMS